MITKEQYEQALKIIKEFENNQKIFSKKCCVCSTEIKSLYPSTSIENSMWDSGLVAKIQAGYGSCHDTDSFIIGICDECIKELINKNLIEKSE